MGFLGLYRKPRSEMQFCIFLLYFQISKIAVLKFKYLTKGENGIFSKKIIIIIIRYKSYFNSSFSLIFSHNIQISLFSLEVFSIAKTHFKLFKNDNSWFSCPKLQCKGIFSHYSSSSTP